MYVRQFIEGMDQTFIEEHSFSNSGNSEQFGSPEMNQKWLHTSLNIEEEDPKDEVWFKIFIYLSLTKFLN